MRKTDIDKKTHFRSEGRLIHLNGAWYFLSRDGERGPYDTADEAKQALERFVTESVWLATQEQEKLTTQLSKVKINPKAWDNRPDAPPD